MTIQEIAQKDAPCKRRTWAVWYIILSSGKIISFEDGSETTFTKYDLSATDWEIKP